MPSGTNTLIHIVAFLATIWLSIYAYNTLTEAALGLALLGVALVILLWTVAAARQDWEQFSGK